MEKARQKITCLGCKYAKSTTIRGCTVSTRKYCELGRGFDVAREVCSCFTPRFEKIKEKKQVEDISIL